MGIGKKIIGGYAALVAMAALIAVVAFYSLDRVQATYNHFIDVNERLVSGANEGRVQ